MSQPQPVEQPSTAEIQRHFEAATRQILGHLLRAHGLVVQNGPFAGMTYVERSILSTLAPKLLGSYEDNLHGIIEHAITRRPKNVIVIGAGEGYYAVGLARRLPDAKIYAFETNPAGQELIRQLAEKNNVTGRIEIAGYCGINELRSFAGLPDTLIICDAEGEERTLLNPAEVPALAQCEMIVELHDCVDPQVTPIVVRNLTPTHHLNLLVDPGRRIHDYPILRDVLEIYRYLAVNESRPVAMTWAHCLPKRGA